jgi:hypothetical protein
MSPWNRWVVSFGPANRKKNFRFNMIPVKKRSKLQVEVLSLYRSLLRTSISPHRFTTNSSTPTSVTTNTISSNTSLTLADSTKRKTNVNSQRIPLYIYTRSQFLAQAKSVPIKDFTIIEHLIRKGKKGLETLKDRSVTSMSLPPSFTSGRKSFDAHLGRNVNGSYS